jgi:hypothetical protein
VVIVLATRYVPESQNPGASHTIDVSGVLLSALGLAGVTYALTAWPDHGVSARTVTAGASGVIALVAFVLTERRSRHPMLPISLFSSRTFSVINAVTFAIYAALSGGFFFLVLFLQIVAGWTPLLAGAALLPSNLAMILLAGRFGTLATKVGARPLMIAGSLIAASGFVLMAMSPSHPTYVLHILPGVTLFGLGLSMIVAPLTGTVLAAAPDELAGTASGVNNAVARTAGLMAVAALPAFVGLNGLEYSKAVALAPAYRGALLICAAGLAAGAALTAVGLPRRHPEPAAAPS